jgi:hypothetical protein
MEGNARTWFTPKQKAELCERWKSGQCVADIARALERRNKSGVDPAAAAGVRPVHFPASCSVARNDLVIPPATYQSQLGVAYCSNTAAALGVASKAATP